MPNIGEIKRGRDVGKTHSRTTASALYVWCACKDCVKERWVSFRKGLPATERCPDCQIKLLHTPEVRAKISAKQKLKIRELSPHWKGGRRKTTDGYVVIHLELEDFFYPTANQKGLIREHRLVMAKHLGRNLLPWEIVHHRNGIKDDNRIDNLILLKGSASHLGFTAILQDNTRLRKRIKWLEKQLSSTSQKGILVAK